MTIRPAYSMWSAYNEALRDHVTELTEDQLAIQPSPDRWPIWATVGHAAFSACSGSATSPACPARGHAVPGRRVPCPGDEDLKHVLDSEALVQALDSTYAIVERCLDGWTFEMLDEELRAAWDEGMVYTRGQVIQRVFTHDVWHSAEVNETLAEMGMPFDLWE